jgi:hypothetical protein
MAANRRRNNINPFVGSVSPNSLRSVDHPGSTGNNEKTLQRLAVPYQTIHIHPGSHAGYYPGAVHKQARYLPAHGRLNGRESPSQ